MVWQKLLGLVSLVVTHRLRRILNDPHAIQNLSEHHLMRRAAKYTAYIYLKGKKTVEDNVRDDISKHAVRGGSSFADKFKQELKKGFDDEWKKRK